MVKSEFPTATLIRNEKSLDIIAARNRAIGAAANTSILFTLDDDAVFSAPDTVSTVLDCFDHPRVGAVAIPYINYVSGRQEGMVNVFEWTGHEDFPCISSFLAAPARFAWIFFAPAAATAAPGDSMKRSAYVSSSLQEAMSSESANAVPIAHFPSHRAAMQGAILREIIKNRLTFVWERVPWPHMLILGLQHRSTLSRARPDDRAHFGIQF